MIPNISDFCLGESGIVPSAQLHYYSDDRSHNLRQAASVAAPTMEQAQEQEDPRVSTKQMLKALDICRIFTPPPISFPSILTNNLTYDQYIANIVALIRKRLLKDVVDQAAKNLPVNAMHAEAFCLGSMNKFLGIKGLEVKNSAFTCAKVVLNNCIRCWARHEEVKPNPKFVFWSNSGWKKRAKKYLGEFTALEPVCVNSRVHILLMLGLLLRVQLKENATDQYLILEFLDEVRRALQDDTYPDDYSSPEHVIMDGFFISGIYGTYHPIEKALLRSWDPILPCLPRGSVFKSAELLPFLAASLLSDHYLSNLERESK